MAWWDEERYDPERYRTGSEIRYREPRDYHRYGRGRQPEMRNYGPYRDLREGRWEDDDEWVERGAFYSPNSDRADGPFRGRGPKGWNRASDAIRDDVCQRMTDHGGLDASAIELKVEHGEVTLTGTVADRRQKRLAEDIADGVDGVRDVHNRLTLRSGGAQRDQGREEDRTR